MNANLDTELLFNVITIARGVLPCAMTVLLVHFLPWPQHGLWRPIISIALGWAFVVFYTIVVYNPAGIAAATSQGMDSPSMRYDNNTVAVTILTGWLSPTLTAAAYFASCRYWRRQREIK